MTNRPVYIVHLKPEPQIDGIRALERRVENAVAPLWFAVRVHQASAQASTTMTTVRRPNPLLCAVRT